MSEAKFTPMDVDAIDAEFGGCAMKILPPYRDIPDEFKSFPSRNKWAKVFQDWFFVGLKNAEFVAKPGIDKDKAMRNIKCAMTSWEPKHEHKEAGVAYLLSLWFEDVKYERAKANPESV